MAEKQELSRYPCNSGKRKGIVPLRKKNTIFYERKIIIFEKNVLIEKSIKFIIYVHLETILLSIYNKEIDTTFKKCA